MIKKYCEVRDLCRYTCQYRGPAHSIRNHPKAFIEYSNGMDAVNKNLKNITQMKNEKSWLYFIIWLLIYLV